MSHEVRNQISLIDWKEKISAYDVTVRKFEIYCGKISNYHTSSYFFTQIWGDPESGEGVYSVWAVTSERVLSKIILPLIEIQKWSKLKLKK